MMGLIRTAATRPVGVTVLYLAVVLFGVVALRQLAIDLLPDVDVPRISITTEYEGVAPEEIETLITRPIEQATSTIEGVERIEAVSSEGLSRVELQFTWGKQLDEALDDVRVAIDRVRARLPEEAEVPSVFKFDLSAMPVALLGVTGPGDPRRLKYFAEDELSRALERVPGIASVGAMGGRDREIRVALDSSRLSALSVSADQVARALARENRNVSAGDMLDAEREVVIRTMGEFASLEEIGSVVVATRGQQPILVRDVGTVLDTTRKVRGELWVDGEPAIRLRIMKQAGANTVQVIDAMRKELDRLNQQHAGRAKLTVLRDNSEFIRSTISNVQSAAVIGALLAALALLLFLRSLRATLVVGVAIPVSILATFGLMYFRGMTLNVISFGGLALGIGMLVDAAIVILENIYRKREAGLSAIEAAVVGAQEMSGPVVAGTVTTIAVFVPVVFVGGFAGVFFSEMAQVVTFALFCSLVAAMTLVPMLAGRLLARRAKPGRSLASSRVGTAMGSVLSALEASYARLLRSLLAAPWAVVVGSAVLFGSSLMLLPRVGVELMSPSDEGQIDIYVELPVGTPLDTTQTVMQDLERRTVSVLRPGELAHVTTSAGPEAWWRPGGSHQGSISLVLVSVGQRQRPIAAIEAEVRGAVEGTPGAKIQVRLGSSNVLDRIVRGGSDRLAVEVRGHDLVTADALSKQVAEVMEEIPGVTFARPDREIGQLERVLRVDRSRAAELGLSSADVAETVEHYVLGRVATRLRDRGDEFDIRVQLAEADRERLEQLVKLPIVTAGGQRVPLESLVSIEERHGPSTISRRDQERTLRVNAGTADRPLGDIAADLQVRLRELPVPAGFSVQLAGEMAEQLSTFRSLWIGLLLAAFLVYAAMAVQFESARQPLVVMAAVPFAFVGVIVVLLATGTTFNMNSFLGTIVLVGIAVNNAIVLIDTANRYRREHGVDVLTAIVDAGIRRLRPILMTTITTLLGLLPLALGRAEGSEIQAPLARAVVGGLSTATLVTLVLVPSVYLLVERRRAGAVGPSASAAPELADAGQSNR